MEKKNLFMRKIAEVFIYLSSSHMRLLVEVGARVFRKSAAALTAFRLKRLSLEIISTTVIASEFMLCSRKVSRCK